MGFDKKKNLGQAVLFFAGMITLIMGIAMTLIWWRDVVVVFRGLGGIMLALAGMLAIFMASDGE